MRSEDDVLHIKHLPDFEGRMSQRDSELLLSYLTVPYLRIPLVLWFFACPERIHCLGVQQLQDVVDGKWGHAHEHINTLHVPTFVHMYTRSHKHTQTNTHPPTHPPTHMYTYIHTYTGHKSHETHFVKPTFPPFFTPGCLFEPSLWQAAKDKEEPATVPAPNRDHLATPCGYPPYALAHTNSDPSHCLSPAYALALTRRS